MVRASEMPTTPGLRGKGDKVATISQRRGAIWRGSLDLLTSGSGTPSATVPVKYIS